MTSAVKNGKTVSLALFESQLMTQPQAELDLLRAILCIFNLVLLQALHGRTWLLKTAKDNFLLFIVLPCIYCNNKNGFIWDN